MNARIVRAFLVVGMLLGLGACREIVGIQDLVTDAGDGEAASDADAATDSAAAQDAPAE